MRKKGQIIPGLKIDNSAFLLSKQKGEQLSNIAAETLTSAALYLKSDLSSKVRIISEEGKDIKLNSDIQVNQYIIENLSHLSSFKCLSEENVDQVNISEDSPYWIIDPIDGSINFYRNIPLFCISLALWYQNKPLIGVVYEVNDNICYRSFKGKTLVNEKTVRIRDVKGIENAILATGIPLFSDLSTDGIHVFAQFIKKFKKIRMLGSAALSLAWIARGRMDVYFERDIMIWDVAAGIALVEGAGGFCAIRNGRHPYSVDVVAGNRTIVEEMCDTLGWKI